MASNCGTRDAPARRLALPASKRRFQLEMVEAVDRLDLDPAHLLVLQHVKPDGDAGIPPRPQLAIEIR